MTELLDQAARDRITGRDSVGLSETLFVEAGAGSGKTRSLVDRVVALVEAGIEVRNIAAITFTEKAAAELRDRVRTTLERRARRAGEADAAIWRAAVDQVDGAAISTLHAFAQRILSERPIEAGLPPSVEVLDEVASEIEFEDRWQQFRAALLDDPALSRTLLLALAAGVQLDHLRALAVAFDDNWDLAADPARLPWPEIEPPPLDIAGLLVEFDAVVAESADCRAPQDNLLDRLVQIAALAAALRAAPDEYEQLRLLVEEAPSFKVTNCGRSPNWSDIDGLRARVAGLRDACEHRCEALLQACVRRLALAARDFVLDAAAQRRASGRLEFHDLLVLARALLRGGHGLEVRSALRARYRRLLLDEFQDTDPIQIELAVLLASDDPDAGTKPWQDIAVEPGRLFFVGDAKQSIYRFRRADIALFLAARTAFGAAPVRLSTNFRSAPAIIDWVNHTFGRLITFARDSQPEYQSLAPSPSRSDPSRGPTVTLLGAVAHSGKLSADALREREAKDVAAAVIAAITEGWQVLDEGTQQWRPAKLGDVTVLIPARTSLPALERALEARDIGYRAETSSLVYSTPEVRELFAVLRAVADPTDRLSLVTALRSRVFGCGDDDLAEFKLRHNGAWNLRAPLPGELPPDHPVAEALIYLRALHEAHIWLTPSEVLGAVVRDRRLFELGFADARPRDLWRRLRFVIDQAREWSETQGGTLREYLVWARLQASERTRTAEAVLPETDDDSVRILTIHAAKGLEFPITIVSGMSTRPGGHRARVEVVWPPTGPVGLRVGPAAKTQEFRDFEPIDEQLGFHERLRLLYVACTRAKDHLVVSLHRPELAAGSKAKPTNAQLLSEACEDAPHQTRLTVHGGALAAIARDVDLPALPSLADWEAELGQVIARGSVSGTVAATGVAGLRALPADDAGLAKGSRDLDLPPWIKGRYGTAIGRAVHGVLQSVDLDTGAGLTETVAAQAAAEGVVGRERDVIRLAASALVAPSVRASAGRDRWREIYVAAPIGATVLEGYIDLLYRTEDGLVIVDYKTSASADGLDARAAGYRLQGAAYALALQEATGEHIARCVFVFLTPSGAFEREVGDLDGAVAEVRVLLPAVASRNSAS